MMLQQHGYYATLVGYYDSRFASRQNNRVFHLCFVMLHERLKGADYK